MSLRPPHIRGQQKAKGVRDSAKARTDSTRTVGCQPMPLAYVAAPAAPRVRCLPSPLLGAAATETLFWGGFVGGKLDIGGLDGFEGLVPQQQLFLALSAYYYPRIYCVGIEMQETRMMIRIKDSKGDFHICIVSSSICESSPSMRAPSSCMCT